jgi:glycosyltransferase involved in cell wall biosynthesis
MNEHGRAAQQPTITCAMVTRARLERAKRGIDCFASQTYPHRELLIVSDGLDELEPLRAYVEHRHLENVRVISVPRDSRSLGALRNISLAEASGEYVCQWDDDDLYHPQRLAIQAERMLASGCDASFLSDQLQLVERTRSLHWCDWSRLKAARCPAQVAIPNTVMCKRNERCRYIERGGRSRLGEDSSFARAIRASYPTVLLQGLGYLYVYVTHGSNAWHEAHHLRIVRFAGLGREELCNRRNLIETALQSYPLDGRISVCDATGAEVFAVQPAECGANDG